jgi:acetyl/propionyl-CoA carboxylase alpha subunit
VVYIQVEHPVTESIAEVNLPAAQVAVGMGIPLWQVPGNNIIIIIF